MNCEIKSPARCIVAWLGLLLCLGASGLLVAAQDITVLSKDPPILRIFDSDKNQTTIKAFLNPSGVAIVALIDSLTNPNHRPTRLEFNPNPNRMPPELRLSSLEYTYPGTVQTVQSRPQTIAFVFVPLNDYKTAPKFSVIADGQLLLEGEATLREGRVKLRRYTEKTQGIVVTISEEILQRITQAEKIELKLTSKLGKYSFKLNDRQRKCVTALANTIN